MGILSCNRESDQSDVYPADDRTGLERLAKLGEIRGQLTAPNPGDSFLLKESLLLRVDEIVESTGDAITSGLHSS